MEFFTNYKYSKAKIIDEKDSDNSSNSNNRSKNTSVDKNDSRKKRSEKKIKVNEITFNINNFTDDSSNNHNNSSKSYEITKKLDLNFNKTKNNKLNDIQIFNEKRDLVKGVLYKNITIQGENDLKALEQDLRILKIDFPKNVNVKEYLKRNKLLRLNLNLVFRNNKSILNVTNINHNSSYNAGFNKDAVESKNKTQIHHGGYNNRFFKNKTHLEKKIKEFIEAKIVDKTLNASNIHMVSKKEIKKIVNDFHAEKINNTIITINNMIIKNQASLDSSIMMRKDLKKMKKVNGNINTTQLLYKNLDKISERLTLMFKKVLKDIVLNPTNYILEGKLENNLSFMKEEIRDSLSESIEIQGREKIILINKKENKTHSEIAKKINEITNSTTHNKTEKTIIEVIKNLTNNLHQKSNEINFIQTNVVKNIQKNSLNSKSTLKNFTDISNKEINNLLSKKIDHINKIQFQLKKSYSPKVTVELQKNNINSSNTKTYQINKLTELDHKVKNHIKVNTQLPLKLINAGKNIKLNKTQEEKQILNSIEVKNKPKSDTKKHENANTIYKKLETQKNSILEIEKKIISRLPKIKKMLETKKLNDSDIKHSSEKLNKSSLFKINLNSTVNINKKDQQKNSILATNKTKIMSINLEEKLTNLRKDVKILDKSDINNKNYISSISDNKLNKKIVDSIFSKDLSNLHTKKTQNKKEELKHEDLEVDDGSVMAEILKGYKNKHKKARD